MRNHFLNLVFDSVFPPSCFGCEAFGAELCSACLEKMRPSEDMCVFCGKSPTPQSECLCTRTKHLGRVVSLWKYEKPVSQLIKNCKYYDKPRAAILILQFLRTEQLARVLSLVKNCENPTLVPVPPHKDRLQERGFDQARLIAETLSLILAVPVVKKGAVLRILKTPPQAKQNSKEDRLKNVLGAFYLTDPKELSGKTAVLVDDVLTTGATLISLAQTIYHYTRLKTAGIVLAHETRQSDILWDYGTG